MAIFQTNIFVCEICGFIQSHIEEVSMYDDPVVTFPSDYPWEHIVHEGKEKLVCFGCYEKYEQKDIL